MSKRSDGGRDLNGFSRKIENQAAAVRSELFRL
jgi:hypothetical protein